MREKNEEYLSVLIKCENMFLLKMCCQRELFSLVCCSNFCQSVLITPQSLPFGNKTTYIFFQQNASTGSVIKINNGYESLLVVLETGGNQRQPKLTPCTGGMRHNNGCQNITVKCSLILYLQGIKDRWKCYLNGKHCCMHLKKQMTTLSSIWDL